MKRREFLLGTAGVVGAAGLGFGQGQAPPVRRVPQRLLVEERFQDAPTHVPVAKASGAA